MTAAIVFSRYWESLSSADQSEFAGVTPPDRTRMANHDGGLSIRCGLDRFDTPYTKSRTPDTIANTQLDVVEHFEVVRVMLHGKLPCHWGVA